MKNETALIVGGVIVFIILLAVIIGRASNKTQNNPALNTSVLSNSQAVQNQNTSNEISLADLGKNPTAYDGRTISTKGTIVGIGAITSYGKSQIEEGDYEHIYAAYLVDGNYGVYLNIYKNPAIKRVVSGDIVEIKGAFKYHAPFFDPGNLLSNSTMWIDDTGSIAVIGKSNDIVPPSQVLSKVSTFLASENPNITIAVNNSASSNSFENCVGEYTKIWDELCSVAHLPSQCVALHYTDSVKLVNNATKNLLKNCDTKFNPKDPSTEDPSSDYYYPEDKYIKLMIDISNDGGTAASLLLHPQQSTQ
jgi:hypothetical protein